MRNLYSEKQIKALTNSRVRELRGFKRKPKGYSWTVCKQTKQIIKTRITQ